MNIQPGKKIKGDKKTRKTSSPIQKACLGYLKNPNASNSDEKIDNALTHCALVNMHNGLEDFLASNEDHQNYDDLIDALDFYSSSHFVMDDNEEWVQCGLFLIPIVIGCKSSFPVISDDQINKIAKSFREHNLLDDYQSVAVFPGLLDLEGVDFNFVKRKRMLLGMLESMFNKGNPFIIENTIRKSPRKNKEGELSICLGYLPIAVAGEAGDFIDLIGDDDNADSISWRESVGSVLAENADTVYAVVDYPFYYSDAIDEGIMNYAINSTHLKIAKFVSDHSINPEECSIFIGKGDFESGHDVFLYYKNGEKVLDAEKIQLPIPNSEDHLGSIISRYLDCVFSCAEANGIGEVTLFGEDEDGSESQNPNLVLH